MGRSVLTLLQRDGSPNSWLHRLGADRSVNMIRTVVSQAAQYRAAGKYKQAVQAYAEGATLLAKSGRPFDAARMQTNAATVAQQSGDLDTAEKYLKLAQATQRRIGDTEGLKTSAFSLVSVELDRSEREKQPAKAVPVPHETVMPWLESCPPDSMNGRCGEFNSKTYETIRVWTFEVNETKSGTVLHMKAADGSVYGDLLFQSGAFHGGLRWQKRR